MKDPKSGYEALIKKGAVKDDPAQRQVLEKLQALHEAIKEQSSKKFAFFSKKPEGKQGLYIWGNVGRGKSMLMDLFYANAPIKSKKRIHFHAFMVDVHARIHQWRMMNKDDLKTKDPIPPLVKALAEEAQLLCLDEFQVHDVADAMILGRLFTGLFEEGIWVVMTSNRPPESLYLNGLQRDRFLKFIELVCERMEVADLASKHDYRLQQLKALQKVYYSPLGKQADAFVKEVVGTLAHGMPATKRAIEVQGRMLLVKEGYDGMAKFFFSELCEEALGPLDYLTLARTFHTIVLVGIPILSPEKRNEAKRFVTLIDALYEHKVNLIATAAAEPEKLYPEGDGSFEFQRTASRLIEMQSERYLSASHLA